MNEVITYEWSEELGRAALRSAYARARFRLGLGGGLCIAGVGFAGAVLNHTTIEVVFGCCGLLLAGVLTYVEIRVRRMARDLMKLYGSHTVTVAITEDAVVVGSDAASRRLHYSKLSSVKERGGFIILSAGTLDLAFFPRHEFRDEQVAFLRSKIGPSQSREPPTRLAADHDQQSNIVHPYVGGCATLLSLSAFGHVSRA